jgi:hypothetical protein
MSQQKLDLIRYSQRDSDHNSTLLKSLRLVLNRIEGRVLNKDENSEQIPSSVAELVYDVELELQKMCLPYLSIMSLLVHHSYAEALPQGVTRNETEECVLLLRFLGLISSTGPILTSPGDVLMEVDTPGIFFAFFKFFVFYTVDSSLFAVPLSAMQINRGNVN